MQAIVLNGDLKSALSAVRSLGKAGFEVVVGAERPSGMACHSKYCRASFVYPSPHTDQKGFIDAVKAEGAKLGEKPVVLSFSDATYLSLLGAKDELSGVCTLAFPMREQVEIAFDKASTYSLAKVSGVGTIPTWSPDTTEELHRIAESLSYPAVLKTRKSMSFVEGKGVFGTASFIHSKDELIEAFLKLKSETGEKPLIQTYIEGEEYGVEMLVDEGVVFARTVHHRLRSLSPTGGASVLKETIGESDLTSSMIREAEALVEALSWSGPIMVEFKVDSDTREPLLMEINGRFWGSLPLSVFAGVDMPALYAKWLVSGEKPKETITSKPGVTSVHKAGDVAHLLSTLFKKDKMRKHAYPSRLRALRDFLVLPQGTKHDVWSLSDSKPAFMEIVDILKRR